jgi:hypothetical protein
MIARPGFTYEMGRYDPSDIKTRYWVRYYYSTGRLEVCLNSEHGLEWPDIMVIARWHAAGCQRVDVLVGGKYRDSRVLQEGTWVTGG